MLTMPKDSTISSFFFVSFFLQCGWRRRALHTNHQVSHSMPIKRGPMDKQFQSVNSLSCRGCLFRGQTKIERVEGGKRTESFSGVHNHFKGANCPLAL